MKRDDETPDMFGGDEGKRRRDEGIKRVARHNPELMVKGLEIIRSLPPGWRGQIENVRLELERLGKKPTHPNFYGALGREAMKLELLGKTGHRVSMKRARSHARKTDELKRL